jgi:hypothetical protein
LLNTAWIPDQVWDEDEKKKILLLLLLTWLAVPSTAESKAWDQVIHFKVLDFSRTYYNS